MREKFVKCWLRLLRMDGDVVVQNAAVAGEDGLDAADLKSLILQFSDGAAEDFVRFALQFGS